MTSSISNNTSASTSAALAFGAAGLLMLGLQPILLDQLVVAGLLKLDLAGPLAMAEICAIGFGAALSNVLLALTGLRKIAIIATLLLSITNLLTPHTDELGQLFLLRVISGFSGGVLVWLASLSIIRHHTPERLAAVFLLLQSLTQAASAALLALVAIPLANLTGGFTGLAILSLLPLLALYRLRDSLPPLEHSNGHSLPPATPAVGLTMMIVLVSMACIGAIWAFLDAIGRVNGLPLQQVQMVIAGTLVAQIAGVIVGGWLSTSSNTSLYLGLATATLLGLALAFDHITPLKLVSFATLSAAFGFVWLFAMPFQIKLAMVMEPDGRLAMLVPALQLLGSALGPLVAGLLMTNDHDLTTISLTAAGFAFLALLALAALRAAFYFNPATTEPITGQPTQEDIL